MSHDAATAVRLTYPSVAHAVTVFENKPGPLRAHRSALRALGRWDGARAELAALFAAHNRSTGADLDFDAPYRLTLGRVHGPSGARAFPSPAAVRG